MSEHTGRCMCGAVRFSATGVPQECGACHCKMCQRWAGSTFMAAQVPVAAVTWQGEAHIKTLQSSDWAERAWCQRCGSGLYYHVTLEGEMSATYYMPIGLFDDPSGFRLNHELYIDHKLPAVTLDGDHRKMTRADVLAYFGVEDDKGEA